MSPDTKRNWYLSRKGSGEQEGPFDWRQLEEMVESGSLEPEDFIWRKGFDNWKEATSVEEIEELLSTPPPLPEEKSSEDEPTGDIPPPLPQNDSDVDDTESELDEKSRSEASKSVSNSFISKVVIPSVLGVAVLLIVTVPKEPDSSQISSDTTESKFDKLELVGIYETKLLEKKLTISYDGSCRFEGMDIDDKCRWEVTKTRGNEAKLVMKRYAGPADVHIGNMRAIFENGEIETGKAVYEKVR